MRAYLAHHGSAPGTGSWDANASYVAINLVLLREFFEPDGAIDGLHSSDLLFMSREALHVRVFRFPLHEYPLGVWYAFQLNG